MNLCETKIQYFIFKISDDLSTVKILIRQLFGLTKQEDSSVSLSKDIARDLHICLGDIDQVGMCLSVLETLIR